MVAVWGTDYGLHSPHWITRGTDTTRQAASYRAGRVLLAGDAAHVHAPAGGQGLNTGVQDAVNLGWKLAQVVSGTSPDTLLDTYHDERHPVAARVLQSSMAQTALARADDRTDALRETIAGLLAMEEPRRRFAGMMSGLDIRYEFGDGHPLLGRRMPDLDLGTADGPTRVFALLHDARPLLLNLGEPGDLECDGWADRVRLLDARYEGPWELPVIGEVSAPTAVLVRPDGHVAWVGEGEPRRAHRRADHLVRDPGRRIAAVVSRARRESPRARRRTPGASRGPPAPWRSRRPAGEAFRRRRTRCAAGLCAVAAEPPAPARTPAANR